MFLRVFLAIILIPITILSSCNNPGKGKQNARPAQLSAHDSLRYKIDSIAREAKGTVGVAVSFVSTGGKLADTFSYNGELHLPMQSTYKFPLAMYLLHLVDSGKISLNKKIHISAKEMDQDTWSPMADSFEDGGDFTIRELLRYMVSESDNIACDILFRTVGGTQKTDDYIHSLGVKDIAIKATEAEMHKEWPVQYTNWCEPTAMLQLLDIFYKKQALSDSSHALLWQMMLESKNSPARLKGLLPNQMILHKTGTGGTNKEGTCAATNDIGIILVDNKSDVIEIVVYVSDSKADLPTREGVIAKIARAAYDGWLK